MLNRQLVLSFYPKLLTSNYAKVMYFTAFIERQSVFINIGWYDLEKISNDFWRSFDECNVTVTRMSPQQPVLSQCRSIDPRGGIAVLSR
jgi:hypothetical protein